MKAKNRLLIKERQNPSFQTLFSHMEKKVMWGFGLERSRHREQRSMGETGSLGSQKHNFEFLKVNK